MSSEEKRAKKFRRWPPRVRRYRSPETEHPHRSDEGLTNAPAPPPDTSGHSANCEKD